MRIGSGIRRNFFLLKPFKDERINGIGHKGVLNLRDRLFNRLLIGPVRIFTCCEHGSGEKGNKTAQIHIGEELT